MTEKEPPLTPAQKEALLEWERKVKEGRREFPPEDRKEWGFTGTTREEQARLDEEKQRGAGSDSNPPKG